MAKKEDKTVVDVVEVFEATSVEVHLDRDPNDPRKWPVVDGASVEPVDINKPAK